MQELTSTGPSLRTPVSLRVPSSISDAVEAYAKRHRIRKTDAYVHFLQQGIEAQGSKTSESILEKMESRIDEVLRILRQDDALEDASEVRSIIANVASGYPAINKAYLFGSFARNAQRPDSDIDIRLVIDRKMGFNLHDLSHFMKRIEEETGRECDVITSSRIKNAQLAKAIEKEKVLVYER